MKTIRFKANKKFKKKTLKMIEEFINSTPDGTPITIQEKIYYTEDLMGTFHFGFSFAMEKSELIKPTVIGKTLIIEQGLTIDRDTD